MSRFAELPSPFNLPKGSPGSGEGKIRREKFQVGLLIFWRCCRSQKVSRDWCVRGSHGAWQCR